VLKAMGVNEEFIKIALQYLHDWKKDPRCQTFNRNERFANMFRTIEKSESLRQNIALGDIEDKLGMVCTHLDKNL
jgi:DNA topoisomerase IB